jgi:hypothetical protein
MGSEPIGEADWREERQCSVMYYRKQCRVIPESRKSPLWSPVSRFSGGDQVHSFTMLINADTDPVMCQYHRPGEKTRMIVVLHEEDYDAWLDARPNAALESQVGTAACGAAYPPYVGDAANCSELDFRVSRRRY